VDVEHFRLEDYEEDVQMKDISDSEESFVKWWQKRGGPCGFHTSL
jgi:hypothetical protein